MSSVNIQITAFYKFVEITSPELARDMLHNFCESEDIKGTILIASEGINGTVAGSKAAITALHEYLQGKSDFNDITFKDSFADFVPFKKLKIKVKSEIVKLAQGEKYNPNAKAGKYVAPKDWNALISQPDVLLIDTRNHFEYLIGTFKGAKDPNTATFSQLPEYVENELSPKKHKRVAMFCTGGIRCEKSTSYMLEQGYDEVYHLEGGILSYFAEIPKEESLWQGECFIFDDRVTLDQELKPGTFKVCSDCDQIISANEETIERFKTHYFLCDKCATRKQII